MGDIQPIRGPDNEAVANHEAVESEGNPKDDLNGDLNTHISVDKETAPIVDNMNTAEYANYLKQASAVRKKTP